MTPTAATERESEQEVPWHAARHVTASSSSLGPRPAICFFFFPSFSSPVPRLHAAVMFRSHVENSFFFSHASPFKLFPGDEATCIRDNRITSAKRKEEQQVEGLATDVLEEESSCFM